MPLSRFVRFVKENDGWRVIAGPVHKDFEIRQLQEFREPSKTVIRSGSQEKLAYAPIRIHAHVWRDLAAVLALTDKDFWRSPQSLILLLFAGYFIILSGGPVGFHRYRQPVMPFFALWGGYGLALLSARLTRRTSEGSDYD